MSDFDMTISQLGRKRHRRAVFELCGRARPVNILGTRIYSAVWSQRDSPKRGMQPNSVICVEHFGRRT